jgi:hypothetical protein
LRGAGAQPLPRLPERPVRGPLSGSLRKFPRRLGQFPLSFTADPRRVPAPPAMSALNPSPAPRSLLMWDCRAEPVSSEDICVRTTKRKRRFLSPYLVCGFVMSLSPIELNNRDGSDRPDELEKPAETTQRHTPRGVGVQDDYSGLTSPRLCQKRLPTPFHPPLLAEISQNSRLNIPLEIAMDNFRRARVFLPAAVALHATISMPPDPWYPPPQPASRRAARL